METINKKASYEKLSSFLVIALGFLMPVFFLTTTTEFFEFNKLALLAVASLLLVVLVGLKVISGSGLEVIKSKLDFPIFVFLVLFLLSTLFSLDKTSSIWGSQGRWFPSLLGLTTLIIFYYAASPNFKTTKSIKGAIYSLLAGSTFSTLVALLGYFGIYLGNSPTLKNPGFNLAGSVTTTVILAAISAVLSLYFAYKESLKPAKVLLVMGILTNFIYVSLTGLAVGWTLLVLGLILVLLSMGAHEIKSSRVLTMFLTTVLLSFTLLVVFPATKNIIVNKSYPTEVTLPIKASWIISTAAIQDYPLLATGPSTFYLNYTRYKPLSINATNLWNVRFDKPYNEVFNALATVGVLGLAAMVLLGIQILKYAYANLRENETSGVTKALAIGVILSVASLLFTYATVLNMFALAFFVTLLSSAHANLAENRRLGELFTISFSSFAAATTTIGGETSAIKREYANIVIVTPFVLATLFGTYLFARTYLAEYYMRQAIVAAVANKATLTYDFQGKAININPQRDVYQTSYAQTNLVLANALAANKNLTDQDKQTIQTLVAQSIRSTRISTEAVNSLSVTNWETRALIYRSLINVADNASDWAIAAYNTAIQLDPANPALRVDLGGVYYAKGDYLSAANLFRQATALKSDYANAHYNFAQALINLNDKANGKAELQTTLTLIPQGSDDYKKVMEQITSLGTQAAGTTTPDKKLTVEQITGPDSTTTATNQQPLSNPTQQPVDTKNLDTKALPTP